MNLSKDQIRELHGRLKQEFADITNTLDKGDRFDVGNSMRDQLRELSMYDNHPADIGSEEFERSKDLALRDHYSLRLHEIDEALARITEGTYGSCLNCGKDIPYERLLAEPAAEHCIDCQELAEEQEISTNRPVEENFLYPGFGRTFMDNDSENVAYDGEDAWQDVARYGSSSTPQDFQGDAFNDAEEWFEDNDELRGNVQDIESYLTADMHGNPTGFTRNEAYKRDVNYQDNLRWPGAEEEHLLEENPQHNWNRMDNQPHDPQD